MLSEAIHKEHLQHFPATRLCTCKPFLSSANFLLILIMKMMISWSFTLTSLHADSDHLERLIANIQITFCAKADKF